MLNEVGFHIKALISYIVEKLSLIIGDVIFGRNFSNFVRDSVNKCDSRVADKGRKPQIIDKNEKFQKDNFDFH